MRRLIRRGRADVEGLAVLRELITLVERNGGQREDAEVVPGVGSYHAAPLH